MILLRHSALWNLIRCQVYCLHESRAERFQVEGRIGKIVIQQVSRRLVFSFSFFLLLLANCWYKDQNDFRWFIRQFRTSFDINLRLPFILFQVENLLPNCLRITLRNTFETQEICIVQAYFQVKLVWQLPMCNENVT